MMKKMDMCMRVLGAISSTPFLKRCSTMQQYAQHQHVCSCSVTQINGRARGALHIYRIYTGYLVNCMHALAAKETFFVT